MKNLKLKIVLVLILIAVAILIIFAWPNSGQKQEDQFGLTAFAQCLADKEITMYGVYWCPHCQNEKRAFGDAWNLVPYVECTDEPTRCSDEGIEGFPTWIFPDGRRLKGEQGIEKLSQESGCELNSSQ